MESAPAGNRLQSLFNAHFAFVWRLLRRLGVREDAVDDAAQQVFMVLSAKLDRVEAGRERAFLTGTAMRVASNHRRTQARRVDFSDTDQVEMALDPLPDPEASLEQRRRRALLDRALDSMPDALRVVLVLSELEELTNPEVGQLLGLPLGTVASRLRRARLCFREAAEALRNENGNDDG